MKKPILLLAAAALFTFQSAFADWVVVQKMTTDGQTQQLSVKIKGDKTRIDIGDQMSAVADGATGGMVMAMHAQKMLMKMDAETIKTAMAAAGGALGGAPVAKPTATGQKEKVGEYECEIYTWTGQIGSGKFWIAKDFPGFADLNAAQDKLAKAMGNPASSLMPQSSDFPGMTIKSEIQMSGKAVSSELVSAKQEPVDDSAFVLPADYQEMKMPGK